MTDIKLEIKQVFDAPIDKVWDAWTNPKSLKEWKSPQGMIVPDVDVDLKVGGIYKVVMKGDGSNPEYGEHNTSVGGKYLEIEKPKKLVYTWIWEGAPAETHTTIVTVLLSKLEHDKTEVTLIHSGFPDENMREEHDMGWKSTLEKLSKFLGKGK